MNAYLLLSNGMVLQGESIGCTGTTVGEVVFATGMVVFCISPGLLPWWATGLAVGALLVLPRLILPPVRGAYAWYASLLNSLGMGLLFAFIRHSLTKIALLFV